MVWVATYNGPTGQDDWVNSIAVDAEGNVFVSGISGTDMGYSGGDWATIKYDKWGRQVWLAQYSSSPGTDCAFSIATDETGNVYVTGCGNGYTTIKYDPDGNQLWMAFYSFQHAGDIAYDLALDPFGNVYVTGASPSRESWFDYATVKYDGDGRQVWVARYDGGNNFSDEALRLTTDNRGNVYVTGYSGQMVGYTDFATIKYDSSGNPLWIARYDGPAHLDDQAWSIAVDDLGYVYVTGWSNIGPYNSDYTTVRYDSLGNQVWVASYNGPGNGFDKAWSIALDASGCVYVTGESNTSGIDYDYATIKYDAQGNEVWVARYDGPATPNRADYGRAIALDGWGSAYVVGASIDNATDYDIATVKYSAGNLANWEPVTATVLGAPLTQKSRLKPPYPNPFNPTTALSYQLSADSHVKLEVFDISGRLVATLVDGWREAGAHELTFDGSGLPSGIYLARLKAGEDGLSRKLVLLK
jgi:hypothetical protein